LTDIGRARKSNQDTCRFEVRDEGRQAIFVVCDGMGGAQAGNVASEIAAKVFHEHLCEYIRPTMSDKYMESILINAVNFSNYEVYRKSLASEECRGMGTTLVGGFTAGNTMALANVGDSRAYIVRADGIARLTRDHSLVEEMLLRGDITEAEAREHPRRNLITRALGTDEKVEADLYGCKIETGEMLLLCSDGLTNMLSDEDILRCVREEQDLQSRCERLIREANDNGGFDNITVVLISA